MMSSNVDSDRADAYGLCDWPPDALDRLKRLVQILTECVALERQTRPPLSDIGRSYVLQADRNPSQKGDRQ